MKLHETSKSLRPLSEHFLEIDNELNVVSLLIGSEPHPVTVTGDKTLPFHYPLEDLDDQPVEIKVSVQIENLVKVLKKCDLKLQDIALSVYTYSTSLGNGYLPYHKTLDEAQDDFDPNGGVIVDLRNYEDPTQCPVRGMQNGFNIKVVLSLARELERKPDSLDPSIKHTILALRQIQISKPGEGGSGYKLKPLTQEERTDFHLGNKVWVYVRLEEDALVDAHSLAEVDTYVDEFMLAKLQADPGHVISQFTIDLIFQEIVRSIVFAAHRYIKSEDLEWHQVEAGLIGSFCKDFSQKLGAGNNLEAAQFFQELLKDGDPNELSQKLQHAGNLPDEFNRLEQEFKNQKDDDE